MVYHIAQEQAASYAPGVISLLETISRWERVESEPSVPDPEKILFGMIRNQMVADPRFLTREDF
jgi:hypothetical protein